MTLTTVHEMPLKHTHTHTQYQSGVKGIENKTNMSETSVNTTIKGIVILSRASQFLAGF